MGVSGARREEPREGIVDSGAVVGDLAHEAVADATDLDAQRLTAVAVGVGQHLFCRDEHVPAVEIGHRGGLELRAQGVPEASGAAVERQRVNPAVLTGGGLRAGIDAVVARLDLPVQVDVPDQRFPADIEASAYFTVAEALTNVVKHAHARRGAVRVTVNDGILYAEVRDDGIGGADPTGHGLVGMADRVTALGGRLHIESPPDRGTLVVATLPLPAG
jgi:hypothetical protein